MLVHRMSWSTCGDLHSNGVALLSYAEALLDEAKSCYLDKIAIIGGIDPFCSGTFGE